MIKKVVVLGGGIGGVEAAIHLRREHFEVELVSDRDFLFIYPLSIWIPTGETSLDKLSVSLPLLAETHGFQLTIDEVTAVSAQDRSFQLKNTGKRSNFDYLVIALGGHKVKHEGLEHVLSVCGAPRESVRMGERLNQLIDNGSGRIAVGFGGNPKDPSGVRGGPAFEFLFNVHHLLKKLHMREKFELSFFAPMPEPGMRLGKKALSKMDRMFQTLQFKRHTGKKISEFVSDGVVFEDNSKIESDVTMFIAATDGHAVIKASDLPQNGAGFVPILPSCQVRGYPWLYVIGDAAALEGPVWKAKQGHLAEVMAQIAAHDMAMQEGKIAEPKSYLDHVCIVCIMDMGNGAGLVYRDSNRVMFVPMPIVGHWIKKAWGAYYTMSKLKKIPRIPGM